MKKLTGIVLICASLALLGCPQANDTHSNDGGNGAEKVYVKPADETITIDDEVGEPVNMIIIGVKGGSFTMGQPNSDIGGEGISSNEQPVREVTLNSYYLAKTEVTEAQWEEVMGSWPVVDPNKGPYYPAVNITWYDAIRFCNKLSKAQELDEVYYVGETYNDETTAAVTNAAASFKNSNVKMDASKNGYRLPTEAEWEYAAGHGGFESDGTTPKERNLYAAPITADENSNGIDDKDSNKNVRNYAWFGDNSGIKIHEVEKKDPNALGFYDMSGNVEEWCYDRYGVYDVNDTDNPMGNPMGPDSDSQNVLVRGGSFATVLSAIRVTARAKARSTIHPNNFGFRVARSVSP